MTFKIEIREILSRIVEIEADTPDEAIALATKQYEDGEIVLDSDDYIDHEISEQL
jgi:hypothetical protein